tara:strand:- start:6393 stop:6707 length:315 start_codon:yes stop_codon:yes gene_type:complete
MANKPPRRSDFPEGSKGMALFQKALKVYNRTGAASILGLPSKNGRNITNDVLTDDLSKQIKTTQRQSTTGKDLKGKTYKKGGYVSPKSNKLKGNSWSNRDNQRD